MDERPPYPLRERPGLRTRQNRNAISVRQQGERPTGRRTRGTLVAPLPLQVPRYGTTTTKTQLGFEATPSTEVWGFRVPRSTWLQVIRSSEDRAVNCVAVALVDGDNRRVAPLVVRESGIGDPVRIEAGDYKMIAALGLAEDVQVALEVRSWPGTTLEGRSDLSVRLDVAAIGFGMPVEASLAGLVVVDLVVSGELARAALEAEAGLALRLEGELEPSLGSGDGGLAPAVIFVPEVMELVKSTLAIFRPDAPWIGDASIAKMGRMRRWPDRPLVGSTPWAELRFGFQVGGELEAANLRGVLPAAATVPLTPAGVRRGEEGPASELATVLWLDEPLGNWRVRVDRSRETIWLNRAYVVLSGEPRKVQQQLLDLSHMLAAIP